MLLGKFWANVGDLPLPIYDSEFLLPQNARTGKNLAVHHKFNTGLRYLGDDWIKVKNLYLSPQYPGGTPKSDHCKPFSIHGTT